MNEQTGFLLGAHPSFAPVGATEGRIAVIDVGSNSVRLVVFEQAARAPAYFFNEKHACGLGAQIGRTGRLDPDGVVSALATLRRFAALAERMRVAALDAIATAAVRDTEDGPEFAAQVLAETGIRLRVIAGDEEARLAALGVLVGEPHADGVALDMGGASMELAEVGPGGVGARTTLALGPQRLAGLEGAALDAHILEEVERGAGMIAVDQRPFYLVGGAWRAFARIALHRMEHPLQVLHGAEIDRETAVETARWASKQTAETLRETPGLSSGRAANASLAARVLGVLLERMEPRALIVSAFGLREGAYFEKLPRAVRSLDPLLDAAYRLEKAQARFPGFGAELAAWIAPALAGWSKRASRLSRAACLLNDVNWRAHPDYRAASCFETVTRANLAGLDHEDRVFLAVALMHRYGAGKGGGASYSALSLLDAETTERARALGKGMRLGAMISASTPGALAQTPLSLSRDTVTLRFSGRAQALEGAIVERRLGSFATSLGREALIVSA